MSKLLNKKTIILITILGISFLILLFSVKTDWFEKFTFLDTLNKHTGHTLNKVSRVLAQEYSPYFFPHFPQRLIYVLSEAEILIDELVKLEDDLNNQLQNADCKFTLSQCLPKITFDGLGCNPARVLGVPYKNISEIETKKEEIADRIDNLSFLKELLKKEMEGGLEKELATLREEVATELKAKLEDVLGKAEEIISKAKENQKLYNKDYTENCEAKCESGPVGGIKACLHLGSGPQKQIKINAEMKVNLDDLKLGEVGMDKFGQALPDKLQFPKLDDIAITVPPQTLSVCFPFEPITVSIQPPSFATLPVLSFTCPKLPQIEFQTQQISKEYQSPESKKEIETGANTNWYFETLSYLMEECVKLPTMSSDWGGLKEEAKDCYNQDKVIKTIIDECKSLWQDYCASGAPEPPQICKEIKYSCKRNNGTSEALQCQKLFIQENESIPTKECIDPESKMAAADKCQEITKPNVPKSCQYKKEIIRDDKGNVKKYIFSFEANFDPVNFLQEKCAQGNNQICQFLSFPFIGWSEETEIPYPYEYNDPNFKAVETLQNKCQELKDKYPKTPPESCKILSLFTGKIGALDSVTYSSAPTTLPAKTTVNLPLGFGGGIGFDCPVGLPWSPPKISLPDIVIPDIKLPHFRIPPFLEVKLPNLIIEDLILPDVELCDLNNCSDIFPSLYFKLPQLNLPSLDLSVPIPQLPGLDLRTRIDLPSINFSLPQINLFNLLLPELKLPEISLPSPKFSFAITGIDLNAIFDLIFTFILNALDIPDFGFCLNLKIPTTFLKIVFPDYYFSFMKFPEIPQIPFCKDVNQFCKSVKDSLGQGGWLKKAREIETELGRTIDKIQTELDKVSDAVKDVQNAIEETFEKVYGQAIYEAIAKQLVEKGLSLEDYINPKTKEIDLSKVPFPGVFPVKTTDERGERECLLVSVPETNFTLKMPDIPSEISISWPEDLKEITLINPLTYDLPDIPLSNLSYEKEFSIATVGFQPREFSFDFGKVNEGDCLAEPPDGGNPIPVDEMNEMKRNLDDIEQNYKKIKDASQVIIDILE
jgi:hypothetical protein